MVGWGCTWRLSGVFIEFDLRGAYVFSCIIGRARKIQSFEV